MSLILSWECKPFVADYYKFSRTDTGFVFGPINVTVYNSVSRGTVGIVTVY